MSINLSVILSAPNRSINELRDGTMAAAVNTLRSRQNGRHFADDIFKFIFLNENVRISIKISLKLVPRGPINNIPALVQIIAWRRPGDKPLSEPMMVSLPRHICVTWPHLTNWQVNCMSRNQTLSIMINDHVELLNRSILRQPCLPILTRWYVTKFTHPFYRHIIAKPASNWNRLWIIAGMIIYIP